MIAVVMPALAGSPDDWARWRGPSETGVARGHAPLRWSDTENIVWKIPIPGRGFSSPVLWGDTIFVTTAVPAVPIEKTERPRGRPGGGFAGGIEHKFVVMAIDRRNGKVLWERVATTATPHEGYHHRYGSFASNSPVTDGKRVYAFFGSRGLYVYNLKGNLQWHKAFPPMRMRNAFGEGVAPVLHDGKLLLNFDQETGSYLLALDKDSGKELWKVDRDEVSSWSPPLVAEVNGRKQVIVSASKRVRAYDFKTGKLVWECAGLGTNVIPAPVVHNGTVIVMSGHREPNLLTIRLGRTGDLTGTDAIVWTNQRGNSYSASPVLVDGKIYFISDNGLLSCFDASTGKPYYHLQRLPRAYSFKASPVAAGGKLYLATEDGDVVVVKLGETFEVLATNTLADQMFISTPAIAGGAIYLRGQGTLFGIAARR